MNLQKYIYDCIAKITAKFKFSSKVLSVQSQRSKNGLALKIKNKVYIQAYSYTIHMLLILEGSVLVSEQENKLELGKNTLKALHECKEGIPHPTQDEFRNRYKNNPMLILTQQKSWSALVKNSKAVKICLTDDVVTLIPSRVEGERIKHCEQQEEKAIKSDLDPINIGNGLLQAFEKCEYAV